MVTENTRLNFGSYKNRKLKDCPSKYLKWMAENLKDGDFHQWAIAAETLYEAREADDQHVADLEEQANDFLKRHGIDPNEL